MIEFTPELHQASQEYREELYVGAKIIKAKKMLQSTYAKERGIQIDADVEDSYGYRVEYPDNYISWSPQYVFETAYRHVSSEEMKLCCS